MSKEIVKIYTCELKMGKKENIFYKVNNKLFVWDEEIGKKFKESIGKTFEVELTEGEYPKISEIYGETDKAPEVVRPDEPSIEVKQVAKALVKDELTIVRDKPNSRTFGAGKDQVKIYFADASDLETSVEDLYALNLMPADWMKERAARNEPTEKELNKEQ